MLKINCAFYSCTIKLSHANGIKKSHRFLKNQCYYEARFKCLTTYNDDLSPFLLCTAINQFCNAVGIRRCVVAADLCREGGHCGLFEPKAADISTGRAQTGHSIVPSALGEGTHTKTTGKTHRATKLVNL